MIIKVQDGTIEKIAIVLEDSTTVEEVLCMQNSLLWFIKAATESHLFPTISSELRFLLELCISMQIDQTSVIDKILKEVSI